VERVLSVIAMGLTLIPLLVPSLNALIVAQFTWRATAVVYVGVLLAALIMTRRYLSETLRPEDVTPLQFSTVVDAARQALGNRRVLGYILCCVTGYGGLAVWVSASPHLITGWYGRPTLQFGLYWSITILAYLAGGWASVRLLRGMTPDRILAFGGYVLLTAAVALTFAYHFAVHTLGAFLFGVSLYNFGWAMLQPNAQSGALAPFHGSAGRVSALLGFLQLTGGALIAQLFGRLHDGTPWAAVVLMSAAAIVHVAIRRWLCPLSSVGY